MSTSGVLVRKLLRVLLLLPGSGELSRSPQLRETSSLVELKQRGGLWSSSSGDIPLTAGKTIYKYKLVLT